MKLLDFFKKKDKEVEPPQDPPDEVNGVVSFCAPILPEEVFDKSDNVDNFINNLNKKNE